MFEKVSTTDAAIYLVAVGMAAYLWFSGFVAEILKGGLSVITGTTGGVLSWASNNWFPILIIALIGFLILYFLFRPQPAAITAVPKTVSPDEAFESLRYEGENSLAAYAVVKNFYQLSPLHGGVTAHAYQTDNALLRFHFIKVVAGLDARLFPSELILVLDPKETPRPLGRNRLRAFSSPEGLELSLGTGDVWRQNMMINGISPEDWGAQIQWYIRSGSLGEDETALLKETIIASQNPKVKV